MKISYKWLLEYLPKNDKVIEQLTPEKVSSILTSVGLEVESMEQFEEIEGALEGLVVGEVLSCEKHADADKLKVTKVTIGTGDPLQIVCGAPNVAAGQKVVVATVGTTLHPVEGDAFKIKKSKIRGVESQGMLCAEDEIGMGKGHEGIIVLPDDTKVGTPLKDFYGVYDDVIFEIGLTPNRMDAMSHLGVAKDVCAYLSHAFKTDLKVQTPIPGTFKPEEKEKIAIYVDSSICDRYAGVTLSGITVGPSPKWIQNKLRSIGQKPVNNIVDITNFILHESGQPLHAFDLEKISGKEIKVKTLPAKTIFKSLDGKNRELNGDEIMICDGNDQPMCMGGIYGGEDSGVSEETTSVFLESAVFNPLKIRKAMLHHDLRTDAAVRFEKGIDISRTVDVLKRAALLIIEIAGGEITSPVFDLYPEPRERTQVTLSFQYLKIISGKNYHPDTVKKILTGLNFSILRESIDELIIGVPLSNPDISIPADVVEEIMRIDGLDNIEIPSRVKIAPSVESKLEEIWTGIKIESYLLGLGFSEIFTNSVTNSDYFDEATLNTSVRIINSLSVDLDVMRPSMIPSGLESIAYNINRKNRNLLFYEVGKVYGKKEEKYIEEEQLSIFITGDLQETSWNENKKPTDLYYLKGVAASIMQLLGEKKLQWAEREDYWLEKGITLQVNDQEIGVLGKIKKKHLNSFSIKQEVYALTMNWDQVKKLNSKKKISFKPLVKFPPVSRALSMIIDKQIKYQQVQDVIDSLRMKKLTSVRLFDIFENEKIGSDKKSLAITFTFSDPEKTLQDKETDAMVNQLISALENKLGATIRSHA